MDVYKHINDRVEAAAERARNDKDVKTKEEIKHDFFEDMADLFNECIAGDITTVDGRTITILEI